MVLCKQWQDAFNPESSGGLVVLNEESTRCCDACRAIDSLGTGGSSLIRENNGALWVDVNVSPKLIDVFSFDLPTGTVHWRSRIFTQDGKPSPILFLLCKS
jgi:hypothetical protein